MKDSALQTPRFDANKIEKKLRMASGLFYMAFYVKRNQIQKKFPNLSQRELNLMAYALIEKGCR